MVACVRVVPQTITGKERGGRGCRRELVTCVSKGRGEANSQKTPAGGCSKMLLGFNKRGAVLGVEHMNFPLPFLHLRLAWPVKMTSQKVNEGAGLGAREAEAIGKSSGPRAVPHPHPADNISALCMLFVFIDARGKKGG